MFSTVTSQSYQAPATNKTSLASTASQQLISFQACKKILKFFACTENRKNEFYTSVKANRVLLFLASKPCIFGLFTRLECHALASHSSISKIEITRSLAAIIESFFKRFAPWNLISQKIISMFQTKQTTGKFSLLLIKKIFRCSNNAVSSMDTA